ncbi:MAG: DUF362 domain-containing protein [Defluviitaleaceae bacterium]|nr:DUF362 domain-containing protein [Defluviitaleaceae bacterium]
MNAFKNVGFAYQLMQCDAIHEICDQEVYDMIDKVIFQTLGPRGLSQIISAGNRVTIKVNLVGAHLGARGEKGRAIITDPRIVRYVAEKVREIIGPRGVIKVIGTTHYYHKNPSLKEEATSFFWAKLGRSGNNAVNPYVDICYDGNADGILDGTSNARLINLDALGENERFCRTISLNNGTRVDVAFPKFLRTREEAWRAREPNEYTDVFIGLPIFKTHGLMGMTGALKLHYGIRSMYGAHSDAGRYGHNGIYFDETGNMHGRHNLVDYLCAQHLIRSYDYSILDALTLNLQGPALPMGLITDIADTDQKADFILTNCIMASLDPVALDVAATNLMGFDLRSIPLLEEAKKNGIGETDPAHIFINGDRAFSRVRLHLWNQFGPDKYPPPPRVGAMQLKKTQVDPDFNIFLYPPKKIGLHRYIFKYRIIPISEPDKTDLDPSIKITRVEIHAHKILLAVRTVGDLTSGELIIDLNKDEFSLLRNTALACQGHAWDQYFNCRAGNESFIYSS